MQRLAALFVVAVSAAAGVLAASPEPALAQPGGFADVAEDAFYAVPVATLAERGVFNGTDCSGGGFCPDDPIDRRTMAVWVVRILDGRNPAPVRVSRFDDVDRADWRTRFIERMADLGVTTGCGDGTRFCPEGTVTRAQMAVFLSRAYSLPDGPDPGFSDVPTGAWYAGDVARLAASNITAGCGDGTDFCPDSDTSRAQMATFLHRAENWAADRAAQRARAEVNGHDDSINLQVTYDNEEYEATVRWEAPSGDHGQVEHYVLQSRLILEDFGPAFYQIVQAESNQTSYRVAVSNITNTNHLYAFRVIVVYEDGRRLATSEVRTPSNVHKLRDIIWERVVEPNQEKQPWLSELWSHINDSDGLGIGGRFRLGFGPPRAYRGGEYPHPGGLRRTFVKRITVREITLTNPDVRYHIKGLVEELGHAYTWTDGIENSVPIAVGRLYLHTLGVNHAAEAQQPTLCGVSELYADLAIMAFFDRYSDFDSSQGLSVHYGDGVGMAEWYYCGFRLDPSTAARVDKEIPAITRSIFVDQEIPQWFYDTYQEPSGSIDLEELWADITVDERAKSSMSSIAYNLRNEFGGYCSEEQVRKFIEGKVTGITNPWKDGGCNDNVTEIVDETDGTQQSPIDSPTHSSYTPGFVQLHNRPDNCWISINGYVYDVTPGEDGYQYPGPGSIVDLCGQNASNHFESNNIDDPPQQYIVGSVRGG